MNVNAVCACVCVLVCLCVRLCVGVHIYVYIYILKALSCITCKNYQIGGFFSIVLCMVCVIVMVV